MSKAKNPLYVVKNNGKDVEEANSMIDLILKKLNLDALIPVLEAFVEAMLSQVQSYPMFIEVKKIFDQLFDQIITILFELQQKFMSKKA